jgi:tRNA nucleotidyltransferase (CCA-adding enzyme)
LAGRLTQEQDLIESITPLVEHHLAPAHYYRNPAKDKTIRRLSLKLAPHATIRDLCLVAYADFLGRDRDDARSGEDPSTAWLLARAEALGVADGPPKPLLGGRDLIALGMKPSVRFGEILDAVYEEQIRGTVATREAALRFVERVM